MRLGSRAVRFDIPVIHDLQVCLFTLGYDYRRQGPLSGIEGEEQPPVKGQMGRFLGSG